MMMMTRMMMTRIMMMTRSCQRREKDLRAQFSGTRKQFSPPLILINTFLKMFTSTIQHYHPVFGQVFIVGGYNRETNNYDGATIILDPQSKWMHINNFAFENSWADTFENQLFESFFLSFEKREFRRGGDLTWERHRHQVGKTSFECYGLKFSSPTATIKMFKIL